MGEGSDYDPGGWAGHDFDAARQHYASVSATAQRVAVEKRVEASQLVPDRLVTQSSFPVLVMVDVSGSMRGWPAPIFSKLPYLDHEMRTEYLGEDVEICFGAISDTGDNYPLQFQPFTRGVDMKTSLGKLVITDGGSGPGDCCEAYGLAALYALRNVDTPKAVIKPILIMVGDEMPYDPITKADAERFGKVRIAQSMSAKEIFGELQKRFEVFLVQKPYGDEEFTGDRLSGTSKRVFDRWNSLIGAERMARLNEANRVVDVIFGLLAKATDRVDYFREEIEKRQRPDQVGTVYTALRTDLQAKPKTDAGHSVLHDPGKTKKAKDLL